MESQRSSSLATCLSLDDVASRIQTLTRLGEIESANRLALIASDFFLAQKPEEAREPVFRNLFLPLLKNYATQYQPYDFELVDYELYRFSANMPLVRGPRPELYDIVDGNYAVVLGAAQLFGRFQPTPINKVIRDRFGLPVLNLSVGGAGPLLFANSPAVIAACTRASFVVLQVLSGRSIGCEEYPGERMTAPANKPGTARRDRNEILRDIWQEDRDEASRLVTKWNRNYVAAYASLIKRIGRPVIVVWLSDRLPEQWAPDDMKSAPNFGHFPHLVSREMIDSITADAFAYVQRQKDRWIGAQTESRVTGEPAPFFIEEGADFAHRWRNDYYASRESVEDIVDRMTPTIDRLLATERRSGTARMGS